MNAYTSAVLRAGLRLKSKPSLRLAGVGLPVVSPTFALDNDLGQFYQIEVRSQGNLVAEHVIVAANALKAINLVESEYGEPVQAETTLLDASRGNRVRCKVMVAKNSHGYTFEAQTLSPALV
jgi:hypothetical protein